MSGQPTRAGLPPDAPQTARSARLPAEWRAFAAFLRAPALPDRADVSLKGSARALPPLFALDMILMAAVLGGIGLASAAGFELPAHMLNAMELSPLLIGFIVVGAPIAEEAIFRGWLSGRPGHVLAVVAVLAGSVALIAGEGMTIKIGGLAAGLVLAVVALFTLRKREAWGWFQRRFGWLFYASALLFAAVHLTNFGAGGASGAMLPLVLPQFLLALILGYLRVTRGLMTGAALHMLHNAVFAGFIVAGSS